MSERIKAIRDELDRPSPGLANAVDWYVYSEKLEHALAVCQEEIEVTDKILERRNELVHAIPECPDHGPECVPHAIEWIEGQQAKLDALRTACLFAHDELILGGKWEAARRKIDAALENQPT